MIDFIQWSWLACGMFVVLPIVLYLAFFRPTKCNPSGIRLIRWYPGRDRKRIYEFAQYEPGWDGLLPGHENHIVGWKRGNNEYLWQRWEGQLPMDYGWRCYEDYAAGKPPEKLP